MGTKSDDTRTYPLCSKHHNERHAMSGWYRYVGGLSLREMEEVYVNRVLKQKAEGEIT
jgi:hypothetical protein